MCNSIEIETISKRYTLQKLAIAKFLFNEFLFPTEHFTGLEPRNAEIYELNTIQISRLKNLKRLILVK